MFKIADILESLEKLAFEVLTWVVFIPKTLIKILWDPDWISGYVEGELNKKDGRFADYMPPILLLLLITIGLYGLAEIIGLNTLEIKGPETALVGETTTFYTNPTFRWNGSMIGEVWWVSNESQDKEYKLIRYNANLSHLVDFDKFLDEFSSENSFRKESVVEVLDEATRTNPGKFEYKWQEPGHYRIDAAYFNSVGDATATLPSHNIVILEKGQNYSPLPEFDINKNTQIVFENKERAFVVALAALMLPLWISLCEELINRKIPARKELYHNLSIHSMYMAPMALAILSHTLVLFFYVPQRAWVKSEFTLPEIVVQFSLFLTSAILIWFFIAEVRYFYRTFQYPLWATTIFTAVILYVPIYILNQIQTGRNLVTENPQLIWYGLYIVPATIILLGIVLIKVFPKAWQWIAKKISNKK